MCLRSILRNLCEGVLLSEGAVLHVLQGLGDQGRGVRVSPQDACQLVIRQGRGQLRGLPCLASLPSTRSLLCHASPLTYAHARSLNLEVSWVAQPVMSTGGIQ